MDSHFKYTNSNELLLLPIHNLVYVEADGNYSTLVMADKTRYVVTMQLGQIEPLLPNSDSNFIRIGRSLIVNLRYITQIHPARSRLVMADGLTFQHELSASAAALKSLKEYIESL